MTEKPEPTPEETLMTEKPANTFAEKARQPSGVSTRDLIGYSLMMAAINMVGAFLIPPVMVERMPWVQYPLYVLSGVFVLIAVIARFVAVTPADTDETAS